MENIKHYDAELKYVEAMYLYANSSSELTIDEAGSKTAGENEITAIEKFFLAGKVIIKTADGKYCRPVAYANKKFTCVVPSASASSVSDVVKDFTLKTE